MKYFTWNNEKNEKLKLERGISFEDVILSIENGDLLEDLVHPNQKKYMGQRMLVVGIKGYAYLVPYIEKKDEIFLKTVIPSRKATKTYIKGGERDEKVE